MGQVFSTQSVVAGRIPELADFMAVDTTFKLVAQELIGAGALYGVAVFGSCAPGNNPNIRSDFDCQISHDGSDRGYEAVTQLISLTDRAGRKLVPIGDIPYPRPVLASGAHELDRFFGQHLMGPFRAIIGEDPAADIRFDTKPGLDIMNDYARNKKRKLSLAFSATSNVKQLEGTQRMLELPLAIGRKALLVVDELEGIQNSPPNSADKTEVARAALELYEELGVESGAYNLLELEMAYNETLSRTLIGHATQRDYNLMLKRLYAHLPESIRWLHAFDLNLNKRFAQANVTGVPTL